MLTANNVVHTIWSCDLNGTKEKNRINQRKHRLSFELARKVFDDPLHLTKFDRFVDGEERWHTLGTALGIVLILVVHTYRSKNGEEIIRIISARKATSHERRQYEQS